MNSDNGRRGNGEHDPGTGDGHEHPHSGHQDGGAPPGVGTGVDNWRRSNLPFAEKLRLAARNTMIKLRNRTSCCGHHGEPGC